MSEKSADVIIVGAGIIGNAAAYYLALKGISVLVLEGSEFIGNGGSSRNGGGVRQSGRDKREIPIAMWGINTIWPTLSEELGIDCEYYQEGNLRLGKTEEHLKTLETLTNNAQECGLNVQMIHATDVRAICPYLSEEVIGASWCPTDGHANPLKTTLAYYKRARDLGVQFYTGAKVTQMKLEKGVIKGVETEDGKRYFADKVLIAAGIASRKIANTVGIDIPMMPQICEALVTEAQPEMFKQMLGTAAADFYGHQSQHGSFVFGGSTGLENYGRLTERTPSSSITAPCICRGVMDYFPILKPVKIIRTWAGWLDICADGVPVIGEVKEIPGLVLACGFSGHGFGIGPAVGQLLSQLISGEETSVNLFAFRYNRFRAKI